MGNIKVVMNNAGCNEIRNSPGVQERLLQLAQGIATTSTAMGTATKADVQSGRTRAHARAYVADAEADTNNRKTNALLKSLGNTT